MSLDESYQYFLNNRWRFPGFLAAFLKIKVHKYKAYSLLLGNHFLNLKILPWPSLKSFLRHQKAGYTLKLFRKLPLYWILFWKPHMTCSLEKIEQRERRKAGTEILLRLLDQFWDLKSIFIKTRKNVHLFFSPTRQNENIKNAHVQTVLIYFSLFRPPKKYSSRYPIPLNIWIWIGILSLFPSHSSTVDRDKV